MLIQDKKHFIWGALLMVGFIATLIYMFTPNFGGTNAFHASDTMFNSISKGSTYYIPAIQEEAKQYRGQPFALTIFDSHSETLRPMAAKILTRSGMTVEEKQTGLHIEGDLGDFMKAALQDADAMFANKGTMLESRYAMPPRQTLFLWWKLLKDIKLQLDLQKQFKAATFIDKRVIKRGVEVGYNYYGIEKRNIGEEWPVVTFALIFYVIYTLWFGYAIFFMFEGLGLQMTAGKKKEV